MNSIDIKRDCCSSGDCCDTSTEAASDCCGETAEKTPQSASACCSGSANSHGTCQQPKEKS